MVAIAPPDLAAVAAATAGFLELGDPDRSWSVLLERTRPALDLSRPEHRTALHTWLNAWGCRLPYPPPGGTTEFDGGIAAWWRRWSPTLPAPGLSLARADDTTIAGLAVAYGDLSATPVGTPRRARTLGPTAAAKTLYALRPAVAMPWDAAIALRLHGARDAAAFERHLRMGRSWALSLLAETGLAGSRESEETLAATLGRGGVSLAKVLDEYCYMVCTRGAVTT
jgi:hypothetical protein